MKEGDRVRRGAALFFDKRNEALRFCSPAAGTVKSIVYGPRRAIESIAVEVGGADEAESFGKMSPAQIAALPPAQRTQVDELTRKLGTYLIGRAITQGALIAALCAIGVRLGAQQAAKLAPLVGQVASGALSGWMFLRLCERHIRHCEQVRAELPLLPAPETFPE